MHLEREKGRPKTLQFRVIDSRLFLGDLFFEDVFDGKGNNTLAGLFEKGLYFKHRIGNL